MNLLIDETVEPSTSMNEDGGNWLFSPLPDPVNITIS